MRVAAILSSLVVVVALGAATVASAAEVAVPRDVTSPPFYINTAARFAIMYPGAAAPVVKDIRYTTKAGAVFPARQYSVVQGANAYSVTVVDFSTGPAVDTAVVQGAVDDLIRKGRLVYEAAAEYEPGVGSRQLMVSLADGRQIQASVYMWDHHLHITEGIGMPGTPALLRFAQSITLLMGDGGAVNNEVRP